MRCYQCGKEFEGRKDARFCSGACRAKSARMKEEDLPSVQVDEEREIVPLQKEEVDEPLGIAPKELLIVQRGLKAEGKTNKEVNEIIAYNILKAEEREVFTGVKSYFIPNRFKNE